ncbi:hypothetical protein BV898_17445 [Hypsibius exemplaris]|uniref:Uncharacterized protein n=1 Tax=Hypsibius exemplaris TaxID=2072580 RepID=A0A9X6NH99_HYPEX|nr:hypothetical protein BV898_17445 [Hypsibius exemplaris]
MVIVYVLFWSVWLLRSLAMTESISVKVATRTFQATDQPSKVVMLITVQDTSIPDAVYDITPVEEESVEEFQRLPGSPLSIEDIVKAAMKRFRRAFMPTLKVSEKSSSSGFPDTATSNGTKVDVKGEQFIMWSTICNQKVSAHGLN